MTVNAATLWMALSEYASMKEEARNGPNPPNIRRDLSRETLTANEIMRIYHIVDPHEAGNDERDYTDPPREALAALLAEQFGKEVSV